MENFFPNSGANSKRYNSSVLIGIILAAVLLVGGMYWLYHQPVVQEAEQSETQDHTTVQAPAAKKSFARKENVAALPPQTNPLVPQSQPVAEATANNTNSESPSLNISFIMIGRELIEKLTQDGDGHVEVGKYSMSIVPNIKTKYDSVSSEKGFAELGSETRDVTPSQPSLVFRGGKEPKSNEAIGFFVETTPLRTTDNGMEYKLSIKRSLPEVQPSGEVKVVSQPFDENVVIPNGSGAVIAGLLPRKTLSRR